MNEFELIFAKQLPKLLNLNHNNKKLIVCFSSVAGSGKTELAKEIETKFNGVRISNDDIRGIIDELGLAKNPHEKQELLQNYLKEFLISKVSKYDNGLLILDSSIDRKYHEIKTLADELGYKVFVVSLVLPRDVVEKRIRTREKSKENYQDYLDMLDSWYEDNRKFSQSVKADITIDSSTKDEFSKVVSLIDTKL